MTQETLPIGAPPGILSVKTAIDTLVDLGIQPASLSVRPLHGRTELVVTLATRTDYERVVDHLRLKSTERKYPQPGQRQWYAERDTDDLGLLVQVVSFTHHDDWQPRGEV